MIQETIESVLEMDFSDQNVLIIGCPASGKTYLSNQIQCTHKKIHTDDYLHFGYEQSVYIILNEITAHLGFTLVEGVQGYRLLRKGAETGLYSPDIVIEMTITTQQMLSVYRTERRGKNVDYLDGFVKMNQKILNDYLRMPIPKPPKWIRVYNPHSTTMGNYPFWGASGF